MDPRPYDVVVIGAGPAGEACAAHVARGGASVALVERELVGGECAYWGCMPSKALLRPAQALAEAQRYPGAAQAAMGTLDVQAVLDRRDEVVRGPSDGSHTQRVERIGVDVVRGHGRLAGDRRVEVTAVDGAVTVLEAARAVVLAPGTSALVPPVPGLREANSWTNREVTLADEVPRRLLVLGGGVIGIEMADAFASLGSSVTVVEGGEQVLGREEPAAAALVLESLRARGVRVQCNAMAVRASRRPDGSVELELDDGTIVEGDEILVAVGRRPATSDLGLETVGIETDERGNLVVNDCMTCGADWLYAIGDANGRALLTHTAVYQAKVAARGALGHSCHAEPDLVSAPRVVFTEPQVAAVGHTLSSAGQAGIRARAYDRDPQRTAAGSFHGRGSTGFARLVVDLDAQALVGATFVGIEVAELLHAATIAIVGQVPIERLQHCVAAFPTRSEVWSRLVELMGRDPEIRW